MDYLQRLTVLQTLHAQLHLQLSKEIAGEGNEQRVNEYHQLLRQMEAEITRIQKMRTYQGDATKIKA